MTELNPSIPASTPRRDPLRAAGLCLLVGLGGALVPFFEMAGLYAIVLAMFLCWILPIYLQWQRGTLDYFEPVHAMGLVYFVYFGLGSLWAVSGAEGLAYDHNIAPYVPGAAFICLLGYMMLLAGYYLPWSARREPRETEEFPRGSLFVMIPAALGFVGFLAQILWYRAAQLGLSVAGLISSLGQVAPLFVFAWALAWLLFWSRRRGHSKSQLFLMFAILVPATCIIIINSLNNKSMTISLVGVPLMALWYARRKIPWIPLLLLLFVVVFVIFPFNNTFRRLDNRLSTTDRLSLTTNIIGQWDGHDYIQRSLGTFEGRMALINSVAVVMRDVDRWVPYAHGRTIFMPTLVFFVPRAIWPEKPALTFGREFGETFRVVHVLDDETNMAVTVPGELYWNFGGAGVLIGMGLWGLLLRLYYRRYGEVEQLDPIRRAIHMVLLIQFLHFEAGIAAPTVLLIRTLVVLELYRFVCRRFGLISVRPAQVPGGTPGPILPAASGVS